MSRWRRLALESFPDLRSEIETPGYSPYRLFAELLPRLDQAHRSHDEESLKAIYGFAYWCARQDAKDLWNAAGVSFFEHVFDDWTLREQVVAWISPQAAADSWSPWEMTLSPDQLSELRRLLRDRKACRYRQLEDAL